MPAAQLNEKDLPGLARERIASGELPAHVPRRLWGGKGGGEACALCDQAIVPDEMQLEIRTDDGEQREVRVLCFHVSCHSVWERECRAS